MFDRLFNIPLDSQDSLFIFGPRGTGKTQWLKAHLKSREHIYVDLLHPGTFRQLKGNPEALGEYFPAGYKGWVVIDEVQKVPELLDEVHRLIEHGGQRFILTGSSARKLKRDGVNLLAGRALHYHMHPLVIQELKEAFSLEHAFELGMLPATYTYDDPKRYLATYVETYLREEVIQEGLTRNVSAFSRFLEVASYSQGATTNYTEIAREVGVDRQLIQNYFSILNDLFLSHTLTPFTKRAKRRLITSEKFYYFDSGVYHELRPTGLLDSPSEVAGPGLETLVYQSILAILDYKNLESEVFYWRTSSGSEVDFIIYNSSHLLAIEVKHAKTITPKFLHGLREFKKDYPMARLYIIYLGSEVRHLADNIIALPLRTALLKLPDLLSGVEIS